MKSRKSVLQIIITVWIFIPCLLRPISLYEYNMKINENINSLNNAATYTDLPYFTWGWYGGESAYDIAQDSSNNTYIVGYTSSFGAGILDLCLLKLNSAGELEWNKTYGGIFSDWGTSMVIDSLDNIYITGFTDSYGAGGNDIWVLKLNGMGNVEWNHTWGGVGDEYGWSIALDSQNNAYVTGSTNSFGAGDFDACLIKFNSSGAVWNYTAGGIDQENAHGLTLDPQGNIYVVGSTKSFGMGYGNRDLYLIKFNSTGMIWNCTWGCADNDQGTEVMYTPSGDLYVAGYHQKSANCSKPAEFGPIPQYITLLKFTSDGIYQWNHTWDESNHAYTYAMVMDSSGNTYIAGYTDSSVHNDYDMCLIRFNSSGLADWSCIWGGSESELTQGLTLGPNGTALVVGYTMSYSIGSTDLCMVEFKIGQCPVNIPVDGNPLEIPGYQTIILIGIAFTILIFILKKKPQFEIEKQQN
jgi:uncharacterized delta-60 repeat protein